MCFYRLTFVCMILHGLRFSLFYCRGVVVAVITPYLIRSTIRRPGLKYYAGTLRRCSVLRCLVPIYVLLCLLYSILIPLLSFLCDVIQVERCYLPLILCLFPIVAYFFVKIFRR